MVFMDIVVWGAGVWGERCMSFLPNYGINVVAFIDSNEEKIGTFFLDIPVISLATYEKRYNKSMIVLVAVRDSNAVEYIEDILKGHNITYFLLIKCPSELYLTHVNEKVPFDEYVGECVDLFSRKKVGVTGWNLFSLLLYDYLMDKGFKVYWVISLDEQSRIYGNVLNRYDFVIESDLDCLSIEAVFCTSSEKMNSVRIRMINFFKFNIPLYRNDELQRFRDIYNGGRCFVVANGPSLRMRDLQCLYEHNELCFGVNGIYNALKKTDWRPDFYVASDPNMLEYFGEDILALDLPYKFLGDTSKSFWKRKFPSNIYRFHLCATFDMKSEIPFSEDVSSCTYDAGTVVHSVLQFAVYMGFKEIYIIGADCQLVAGKANHFNENYCVIKNKKYILSTDLIIAGYEAAKKYADAHGIKIYNATRGGALEVFERVNFDEIFSKVSVEDV